MRLTTRATIFFGGFRRAIRKGKASGLSKTAGLIRKEARQLLRVRRGRSRPGQPPHAHTTAGLRLIEYWVENDTRAYIGPVKFRRRNSLSKPVPHVHEKGGVAIERRRLRSKIIRFPERSYMWTAVKRLKVKGKLNSQFKYSIRG